MGMFQRLAGMISESRGPVTPLGALLAAGTGILLPFCLSAEDEEFRLCRIVPPLSGRLLGRSLLKKLDMDVVMFLLLPGGRDPFERRGGRGLTS